MALEAGLREELDKYIRRYYDGPPEKEGFEGKGLFFGVTTGSFLSRSIGGLERFVRRKPPAEVREKEYLEADDALAEAPCAEEPEDARCFSAKALDCRAKPKKKIDFNLEEVRLSKEGLSELVGRTEEGFSETVLKLIDDRGFSDSEVYKRAGIDRRHFSKIRSNRAYRPTKETALALAIALKLSLAETQDLLRRAGYALSHSSRADIIVEYFIVRCVYDRLVINEALADYAQPLIGA